MPDAPGVGEFAGAFNGGAVGGQQALLDQMRRQEIARSVMARFQGLNAPTQQFNFAPPNQIAGQPSTADLQVPPAYQVPVQRTSDSPPTLPATQGLQLPAGFDQQMAKIGPQMAQPSLPSAPPPGMEAPPPGLPQGPDPNTLAQWRDLQRHNAQVAPNQAYSELRNQGFTDQEIFGILSNWKDLPDTVTQKLQMAGNVSARPYAEGSETPDALREKELAMLQEKGGIRGLGPMVAGKLGNPQDYAQSMLDYAQPGPFDPRKARFTPGAGGQTDVIRDSLLKRLQALAPVGPQVLNTKAWLDTVHALEVLDKVDTGVPTNSMSPADQQFLAQNPQYRGVYVPSKRGGVPVPQGAGMPGGQPYVPGGGYSDALPPSEGSPDQQQQQAPEAAPVAAPAAAASNLAPPDAPTELRAQWSRIPKATRSLMVSAAAAAGWPAVMQEPETQQALRAAATASTKGPKK